MKTIKHILTLLFLLTMCISNAQPANDNCPGTTLTVSPACLPTAGTLAAGTFSGVAASCGGLPNHDVFYNFVATYTSHRITVTPCGTMDVVVQVYSGSCGGTSLICLNAAGTGAAETGVITGLTVGNTYWVRVYDFYGITSCTTFDICITLPPAPSLILATTFTDITCGGFCDGSAAGSFIGGIGPFSYLWSGPGSYSATTLAVSGLCAGTYVFAVTDSFSMGTAGVAVIIAQSTPMFNISSGNDTSFCTGGTALLDATFLGSGFPANCGLSTSGGCYGTPLTNTVGTGLTTNTNYSYPAPFANFYTSQLQQYLYTASELNAAGITGGKIDQLGWDVIAMPVGGITTFHEYTIKMTCTSLTALSSTFVTGLVTVFPPQTVTISMGWNAFTFPNGFLWDGTSNIIIEICNNEGPPYPNYSMNAQTAYTHTTYTSSAWWISDAADQCGTPSAFATTGLMHPNIQLQHCSTVANLTNYTYQWAPAFANITNDTAQHTTALPATNTAYILTVTDTATGCFKQDTINVNIYTTINPAVTAAGSTLTATQSGAAYQWYNCSTGYIPLAGQTNQSYNITTNGQYAVIITSATCVDTSACTPFYSVGINENSTDNIFKLYPNPNNGNIKLECHLGDANQSALFSIFDMSGRLVKQQTLTGQNETVLINAVELNAGAYYYTIKVGNKTVKADKLVIVK